MENENNMSVATTEETKISLNKKMKLCKTCGTEIAKSAKRCPSCGAKNKKPIYKRVWFWFLCLIVLFSISMTVYNKLNSPSQIMMTVTDNYGKTIEMTSSELLKIYSENIQSANDQFGGADIEITIGVKYIGNTYIGTLNNKEYRYIEIGLDDGYKLHLLPDSKKDMINELRKGDIIRVKSRIAYKSAGSIILNSYFIDGNTIYDLSSVEIVND